MDVDPAAEAETEAVEGPTGLVLAAEHGDAEALRRYLDAGVSVDLEDPDGWTPLQIACGAEGVFPPGFTYHTEERVAAVALLLDRGASPNAGLPNEPGQCSTYPGQRRSRFTPLMGAAINGTSVIVDVLLRAGADAKPQIKNPHDPTSGYTFSALQVGLSSALQRTDGAETVDSHSYAIANALINAGADVNCPTMNRADGNLTLMQWAIWMGGRRVWPLLLRGGGVLSPNPFQNGFDVYDTHRAHPYLRKLDDAGGFKVYEKAHRATLLAIFAPKFTHLVPPELVPLIVEFSFHLGFY